MVGISKKTPEELQEVEEKQKAYTKRYYSNSGIKLRQREYYKRYNQNPDNKESHRQSQARYRMSAKGRACNERYGKKRNSRTSKDKKHDSIDSIVSI